ncbi:MAG: pilus assembly protein N-terminal domain-containing protein [Archangium sp.]
MAVTSGWLAVLDVEDAAAVLSDDEAIAFPITVDRSQVLIVGGLPGTTTVRVLDGADHEREFLVMVGRAQTIVEFEISVRLEAEKVQVLPVRALRRAIVGNPEICDAVVRDDGQLELHPLNAGMTTIVGWAGGTTARHRFHLIVIVESNGVVRSGEDLDAILTEPLENRRVALIAGERYLVPRGTTQRFAVKDERVITASGQGNMVVLSARSAGATRFVTWDANGHETSRFVVVHERSAPPKPVLDAPPLLPGQGTPARF